MYDVMSIIDGTVGDDLQKIFEEGGVRSKLKEIWMTDKRQNLEQFQEDQAKNSEITFSYWETEQLVEYGWASFLGLLLCLVCICTLFIQLWRYLLEVQQHMKL